LNGSAYASFVHNGDVIFENVYVPQSSKIEITVDISEQIPAGSELEFNISGTGTYLENDNPVTIWGCKTPIVRVAPGSYSVTLVPNAAFSPEILLPNDGSPVCIFTGELQESVLRGFLLDSLTVATFHPADYSNSKTFEGLKILAELNSSEGVRREAVISKGKAVFRDLNMIVEHGGSVLVRFFLYSPISGNLGERVLFKISPSVTDMEGQAIDAAPVMTEMFEVSQKRQQIVVDAHSIGKGEMLIAASVWEDYHVEYGGNAGLLYFFGETLTCSPIEIDSNWKFKSWRIESPDGWYITSDREINLTLKDWGGYLLPYRIEAQFEWNATSAIADVYQADEVKIWGANGQLYLQSATPQNLQVFHLSGQLVFQRSQVTDETIPLKNGVYIVKSGTKTMKVAL
jgi:hypothetical protein